MAARGRRTAETTSRISLAAASSTAAVVELRGHLSIPVHRDKIKAVGSLLDGLQGADLQERQPTRPPRRKWKISDRLTEVILEEIRARYAEGERKDELAEEYEISLSSVKRLIRRQRP